MKEAECKNKADSINSLSLVELAKDIKSIKNYLPYVDSDAGFHSLNNVIASIVDTEKETVNSMTDIDKTILYRDKKLLYCGKPHCNIIRHSYKNIHKACSDAEKAVNANGNFNIYETRMYSLI